jgi:hypothetical protein
MIPKATEDLYEDMSLRQLTARQRWLVGVDRRYGDMLYMSDEDESHRTFIRREIADTHRKIMATDIDDEHDGWTLLEHLHWTLGLVLTERKESGLDLPPDKELSVLMDWTAAVVADFSK